jgi:hypothetical protein
MVKTTTSIMNNPGFFISHPPSYIRHIQTAGDPLLAEAPDKKDDHPPARFHNSSIFF